MLKVSRQNARELRGAGSIDLQRAQTQKKIQMPGEERILYVDMSV